MSSRIEILSGRPDEAELALISAAVLALSSQQSQNAQNAKPAAGNQPAALSAWQREALLESVGRGAPPAASQQAHSLWPG